MNIYFISGMAADKGIFQNLILPAGLKPVYLEWIDPLPGEKLEEYAARLAGGIDTFYPFILVGLSLGGMLAVEIAKSHTTHKLILISTIRTAKELPPYYRKAARLGLHKLIPVQAFKYGSLAKRFFTSESPSDKKYLRKVIRGTDPAFLRWAMQAVLNWQNTEPPQHCLHIHGTRDEILPVRYTYPTHIVAGGGHLMILTRAGEISAILKECLPELEISGSSL